MSFEYAEEYANAEEQFAHERAYTSRIVIMKMNKGKELKK